MAKSVYVRLASLLVLLLSMAALAPNQARADAQADVRAELEKAQKLHSTGDYQDECRAYQRADELAQGKSSPALLGLSSCFLRVSDQAKSLAAARQALAAAAAPNERTEAAMTLGKALLRQPDEASWTEAATLFKEQAAGTDNVEGRTGLLAALLALHRDQEAAEVLQSFRKQGLSEDDIHQRILAHVFYQGGPQADPRRVDDFNEHLRRLDPDAPLEIGGKISRPELLRHDYPKTTAEARQHPGFNGTVILEVNIDPQGNVIAVRALKEQPYGLTEAAVKSVKEWKFKPATLDGKPVTVYYVLTANFKIGS